MTRDDAIELLLRRDIALLTTEGRESSLLNWWSIEAGDPDYDGLPDPLKQMMARSDEPHDPDNPVYDPLLKIAIASRYRGVVNAYLKKQIARLGYDQAVEGHVEELAACPCCGFRSLEESGQFDICGVCFWEDDGTTEPDSHSGPNHMTLREAQENFRRIGAVSEAERQYVLPDGKERYRPTRNKLVESAPMYGRSKEPFT